MKSNVLEINTPEAIALAEQLMKLKQEHREASQKRWEEGSIKSDKLKPASFTLKRRDV